MCIYIYIYTYIHTYKMDFPTWLPDRSASECVVEPWSTAKTYIYIYIYIYTHIYIYIVIYIYI